MLERVLLPLDGSDNAERVLPHARRLLLNRDAEIVVLRVTDGASPNLSVLAPAIEAEAERYARRMAFQWAHEGRPASALVRAGGAAATILRVAKELEVSLIVLSTHGRTGFQRLLMGSVAEKVVRKATCPVMTVKAPAAVRARPKKEVAAAVPS